MISTMPVVSVRHERRRKERGRRPSQLALQLGRSGNSPSPTPSPQGFRHSEYYVCAKASFLHAVVGSILLGIVAMVVGLVQLSPGAEAAQHRYYLMGAGAALIGAGVLGAVIRCLCIHWYDRKMHPVPPEVPEHAPSSHPPGHTKYTVEPDKHHHHTPKHTDQKPSLKTQASVTSPRQEHDIRTGVNT